MPPPGENRRCVSARLFRAWFLPVFLACETVAAPGRAQDSNAATLAPVVKGQAQEAKLMILLGVQQGISSLPPATGQSFTYSFDYEAEAFVREAYVGPTILRRPEVIGNRRFNLRLAVSYFELSHEFSPKGYELQTRSAPEGTGNGGNEPSSLGFTAFGLKARARVTVLNFAAAYGFWDRFETRFTLPVVIVDADASTEFFVLPRDATTEPAMASPALGLTLDQFRQAILEKAVVRRWLPFEDTGQSTEGGVGVGRIGLGGKALLYKSKRLQLAGATEIFLPSPNEDQLAGTESVAVVPRGIGELVATDSIRLLVDLGYDYDFEHAELRRFVWNTGVSVGHGPFTVDLGFGGSEYAESVKWTPDIASARRSATTPGDPDFLDDFVKVRGEDNQLSTTTVDLLLGLKLEVASNVALTGAVSVPLDDREFRPDVQGTLGAEVQFAPDLF